MVAFLRDLFKLFLGVVAALVGLYFAIWVALLGYLCVAGIYNTFVANPRYAARVFDGVVLHSRVIASRQWHPVFRGQGYNCTFAVVELDEAAPSNPPESDNTAKGRSEAGRQADFRFAGDWKPTPARGDPWVWTEGMDPYFCDPYPGDALITRLREAVSLPGGWYHSESEYLFVYSKPAALAFRFRVGD